MEEELKNKIPDPRVARPPPIDTTSVSGSERWARSHMIRGSHSLQAPPSPLYGLVAPQVGKVEALDPEEDLFMEWAPPLQIESHEKDVQMVGQVNPHPVQPEMAYDPLTPVVGNIATQVSTLGHQVEILGRVGQSAENCFNLFEERLSKAIGEMQNFRAKCETAFSNVRKTIDAHKMEDAQGHFDLEHKFQAVSMVIGETEVGLEQKIAAQTQRLEFYNHEQTTLSQRVSQLEQEKLVHWESHEQGLGTLRGEVDSLRGECQQLGQKVSCGTSQLEETQKWVRDEVSKIITLVGEIRETPLLNVMSVLQPQLNAQKSEIAQLRETVELATSGWRKEMSEFNRKGDKKNGGVSDYPRTIEGV